MFDFNNILNNLTSLAEIITVIITVATIIWKRKVSKRKKNYTENAIKENYSLQVPEEPEHSILVPLTYKQEVSTRLLETLRILNIPYENLSISKVTEYLDEQSVSEIEDYFIGIEEPTNDFLKKYADYFGLEWEWLKHGNGPKFIRLNEHPTYPQWYKEYIDKLKPEMVVFVRSKGSNGESGMVLQLTKHKFIILPRTYNISSHVGSTGQNQVESFYDLILKISNSYSITQIQGLELEKEELNELFTGEIYPRALLKKHNKASYWWDDFLDFEHKEPIAKDYENLYGIEFIKAQEIVKWKKKSG